MPDNTVYRYHSVRALRVDVARATALRDPATAAPPSSPTLSPSEPRPNSLPSSWLNANSKAPTTKGPPWWSGENAPLPDTLPLASVLDAEATTALLVTWQFARCFCRRLQPDRALVTPTLEQLQDGLCSGEWMTKITTYDQLRVPAHLEAGEYVLGFRWDCEESNQVWQSCADIEIA